MMTTSHKRDDCHSNPKNVYKSEAHKYFAKKKLSAEKRVQGASANTSELFQLKAQVAAQKALLEVKASKQNSHSNKKAT